jgi:hypothetical protein
MKSKSAAEKASHQISKESLNIKIDLVGKLAYMTEVVRRKIESIRSLIQIQNQDHHQVLFRREKNRKNNNSSRY